VGVFLASFTHSLAWLYISYGLSRHRSGLGYIVPVAVFGKNGFPIKEDSFTGIAVADFGSRRTHHRASGDAADSKASASEHICLPRHCLSHRHNHCCMFNAKSAGRLANWKAGNQRTPTSQTRWTRYVLGEALKTWQWWALGC